jgi:hypothetical protein
VHQRGADDVAEGRREVRRGQFADAPGDRAEDVPVGARLEAGGDRPAERVDEGVEIGGVASYLAEAEQSDVNLFI